MRDPNVPVTPCDYILQCSIEPRPLPCARHTVHREHGRAGRGSPRVRALAPDNHGANAGDYTFTQTDQFDHPAVQGTNVVDGLFTYTIQDGDPVPGDTDSAGLTIRIMPATMPITRSQETEGLV